MAASAEPIPTRAAARRFTTESRRVMSNAAVTAARAVMTSATVPRQCIATTSTTALAITQAGPRFAADRTRDDAQSQPTRTNPPKTGKNANRGTIVSAATA